MISIKYQDILNQNPTCLFQDTTIWLLLDLQAGKWCESEMVNWSCNQAPAMAISVHLSEPHYKQVAWAEEKSAREKAEDPGRSGEIL